MRKIVAQNCIWEENWKFLWFWNFQLVAKPFQTVQWCNLWHNTTGRKSSGIWLSEIYRQAWTSMDMKCSAEECSAKRTCDFGCYTKHANSLCSLIVPSIPRNITGILKHWGCGAGQGFSYIDVRILTVQFKVGPTLQNDITTIVIEGIYYARSSLTSNREQGLLWITGHMLWVPTPSVSIPCISYIDVLII